MRAAMLSLLLLGCEPQMDVCAPWWVAASPEVRELAPTYNPCGPQPFVHARMDAGGSLSLSRKVDVPTPSRLRVAAQIAASCGRYASLSLRIADSITTDGTTSSLERPALAGPVELAIGVGVVEPCDLVVYPSWSVTPE